jgi:WD40 repeat protein
VSGLARWRQNPVTDLAWVPGGAALAVAGLDEITLYDPLRREELQTLDAGDGLAAISFSPNGFWLASGSYLEGDQVTGQYGEIRLWRGLEWEPLGVLHVENRGANRVAFSPNGDLFAAGFTGLEIEKDSSVEIWSTATWEITRTLRTGTALNLAFSPDGRLLASVPDRYAVKVWQLTDGRFIYNLQTAFTDAVNSLVFSPNSTLLATGHYDGSLRLWDMSKGSILRSMQNGGVVESLAFSPDGSLLAAGSSFGDNNIRLWSVQTGELLRTLEGHLHGVEELSFSPDGRLLASASYDGSVRLWGIRP